MFTREKSLSKPGTRTPPHFQLFRRPEYDFVGIVLLIAFVVVVLSLLMGVLTVKRRRLSTFFISGTAVVTLFAILQVHEMYIYEY